MNTLIELEQSTSEHLFFVFFLNLLHNQHSFLFSLSDVLFTSLVFFWSNEMHSSSLFFSKCLNNRQYPIHNNSDDAWQTRSQSDEYHALTECSYAATRKVSPKVDCVHSHHQWSMDTIALTNYHQNAISEAQERWMYWRRAFNRYLFVSKVLFGEK